MTKPNRKYYQKQNMIFVENLTAGAWLFKIFPYLCRRSIRNNVVVKTIFYIDASRSGIFIAKLSLLLLGLRVESLKFRLMDIRDQSGDLLRLKISFEELSKVQDDIVSDPVFEDVLRSEKVRDSLLGDILRKETIVCTALNPDTVWRMIFLVHLAVWKSRELAGGEGERLFFVNRRAFMENLGKYAASHGVTFLVLGRIRGGWKKQIIHIFGKTKLQAWYYAVLMKFKKLQMIPDADPLPGQARIMTEYYGHLNLDRPECNSDLFFWQESDIAAEDIVVSFKLPGDPLDAAKWGELKKHNLSAVVLNPRGVTVSEAPAFYHSPKNARYDRLKHNLNGKKGFMGQWLRKNIQNYYERYDYWFDFFRRMNVKVYVLWYVCDTTHSVMGDALRNLGGVLATYQRSWVEFPTPETTVTSDIFFGFSKDGIERERATKSRIPYYVVTGYIGDHRFPLLKEEAKKVREGLMRNGAKRIIAYFDENSLDDSRWHTGHELQRVGYEFLFQKLLEDKDLGLVIKPKAQLTLRRRLGPAVRELLERALETGRCRLLETDSLYNPYPPSFAALASDVAIHGHLCCGSAGLDSALAGVPTLLVDLEGWSVSPLYQLGIGKVVFKNWNDLWRAWHEHSRIKNGIPGFGDWSPMIDEFDPFRDGRAAERVGAYLKWLLDGLKEGLSRETVLARAAERYADTWGEDKIFSININNNRAEHAYQKIGR